MKIYEFLFCSCIYESSFATVSIHKTKKGAWKAMNKFLNDMFMEEYNERIRFGKFRGKQLCGAWKIGRHQSWSVGEIELLD
jgi:hypothetical protein